MDIIYRNKKVEKCCTDYKKAVQKLGMASAKKLFLRKEQISSFDILQHLIESRLGRCHKLIGNLDGYYTLDLEHPYRLAFIPYIDDDKEDWKNIDPKKVVKIKIMGVIDDHGGKINWVVP